MKSMMPFAVGALAVAALLPLTASALDARNHGHLLDPYGEIDSGFTTGLCWRWRNWTPARTDWLCEMAARFAYAPATTPLHKPAAKPAVLVDIIASLPVAPEPVPAQ